MGRALTLMRAGTRHALKGLHRCLAARWLALLLFLAAQFFPAGANALLFGRLGLKDEKEMGRRFDAMMRSHLATIEDPEIAGYVNDVLGRLARGLPPQPFQFRASVLRHNSLNAFAVPGGYVFVFSGMIMNLQSEDELAGVLAHELAHVTQRHVASRMERAQYLSIASLLLAIAGIAAGGPGGHAIAAGSLGAGQAAMLDYSRADETEADHLGLQYLIAAGYAPHGMTGGFKVLRQKSWMSGSNVPAYLSTHPALSERINGLGARIGSMPASVRQRKPDSSRFARVKTLLLARYGDPQAALRSFSGQDALSQMGRGIVLARQNRISQAAECFERAVLAAPGDSLIQREAGAFNYRKGNPALAEGQLKKALALDGRDYMASFFLARLYDESGKSHRAENHYGDILRQIPEQPEVHEAYAKCLAKSGKNDEAFVHMAYGAIYANDRRLAKKYFGRCAALSDSAKKRLNFARLEKVYAERKEMWGEKT